MDIVIYTSVETLVHKKGLNEPYSHFFWSLSRRPKNFEAGDKVFFAVKGEVKGYFISDDIGTGTEHRTEITWAKDTWKDLEKPIPTKPFRGFRYRWW